MSLCDLLDTSTFRLADEGKLRARIRLLDSPEGFHNLKTHTLHSSLQATQAAQRGAHHLWRFLQRCRYMVRFHPATGAPTGCAVQPVDADRGVGGIIFHVLLHLRLRNSSLPACVVAIIHARHPHAKFDGAVVPQSERILISIFAHNSVSATIIARR